VAKKAANLLAADTASLDEDSQKYEKDILSKLGDIDGDEAKEIMKLAWQNPEFIKAREAAKTAKARAHALQAPQ